MKINDKIKEIRGYLAELSEIAPKSFEDYKEIKIKAACERYFEKIVESVIDLAFLVIRENRLRVPEDDGKALGILSEEGIISEQLAERLRDAKGMRNVIAHEYGRINDELVFHSITCEIERDVEEFISSVKKR